MDVSYLTRRLNDVNLKKTLDLLNRSQEIQIRMRIVKLLAAYAMNNRNIDVIIKYKHLYEILYDVLVSKRPQRIVTALNLICALLYIDNEEATGSSKGLAMYARNMIRASGCLTEMTELFASSMLNQETWRALCVCLAETCRRYEPNQTYCSYLIPLGIMKCKQGDTEVLMVLQSLLHQHTRNVQLFLDNDGLTIFTREKLQHEKCMQLLNTLLQNSPEAISLLRDTSISHYLYEILNRCGPNAKLGQWATIILYQIHKELKEPEMLENMNTKIKWPITSTNVLRDRDGNDTDHLFQNIVKEIYQWEGKEAFGRENVVNINTTRKQYSASQFLKLNPEIPVDNVSIDTSFSFLMNWKKQNRSILFKIDEKSQTNTNFNSNSETNNESLKIEGDDNFSANTHHYSGTIDLEDFKPQFISTPKRNRFRKNQSCFDSALLTLSSLRKNRNEKRNSREHELHKEKKHRRTKVERKMKNHTMSARVFKAINDSCTTIVKTFKNIFRAKNKNSVVNNNQTNESSVKLNKIHSHDSFVQYMRKRDAIIQGRNLKRTQQFENTQNIWSNTNVDICKTCNDTAALKVKAIKDDNLKNTLKKLKLGINLYGCDFKKISKTMWPQETYMTPSVLYNLYRKLIVK